MNWLSRNRQAVWITLLNVALTGAVVLALRWPSHGAIEIVPPTPQAESATTIRVYVTGAVVHPDVYDLPAGSILRDAIAAAGGAASDADLEAVNLAVPLSDAEKVTVPRVAAHTDPSRAVAPAPAATPSVFARINVNNATLTELDTLPGIGKVTAQAIVDYRIKHGPFVSVESLLDVPGIGEGTLGKIRDLVTVR